MQCGLNSILLSRLIVLYGVVTCGIVMAEDDWKPKPVPSTQAVPLPGHQISFRHHGRELTRCHYAPEQNRPFLFPIIGPSGNYLTRMGHPHDPESHSHHNSIWISHHDVNGVDFWGDRGKGRIVHLRVNKLTDADGRASIETENEWRTTEGDRLLHEKRRIELVVLSEREWLFIIDVELKPSEGSVQLGDTPFGLIGVRMAKTIGVHDGGGRIRNSEGGVNEEEIFWKRARWVDYSGAVDTGLVEGVTLLDHPSNPNHPSIFHVRNDGWMGACLTKDKAVALEKDQTLKARYGLLIHSGAGAGGN